jgi:hypothetical protein
MSWGREKTRSGKGDISIAPSLDYVPILNDQLEINDK